MPTSLKNFPRLTAQNPVTGALGWAEVEPDKRLHDYPGATPGRSDVAATKNSGDVAGREYPGSAAPGQPCGVERTATRLTSAPGGRAAEPS